MLEKLFKFTDAYKNLPREVLRLSLEQVGHSRYIYALLDGGKKVTVGRYKTAEEAQTAMAAIKNITESNNK